MDCDQQGRGGGSSTDPCSPSSTAPTELPGALSEDQDEILPPPPPLSHGTSRGHVSTPD